MRRRRSDTFIEQTVEQILVNNTFGGSKEATKRKQQIPVIANEGGIKLEWDNRSGEYPTMVSLRMTDGQWVKYQIYIEQPEPKISPALKDLENMQRGYPMRRKRRS